MQAKSDLSVPTKLVQPLDQVEISSKQGDCYVSLGYYTIRDVAQHLLMITPNWLCAVLTLSKDGTWGNGFWLLELKPQTIDTSKQAIQRLSN